MKLIPKQRRFDPITTAIDPSPTGTGIVSYVGDRLIHWWAATDTKKWIKRFPNNCFYVNKVKRGEENNRIQRVVRTLEHIDSVVLDGSQEYIAIEDYVLATGDKSSGVYQIAELGGPLRILCSRFAPVRTNDPVSVKLAFTGKGNADKEVMAEFVMNDITIPEKFKEQWAELPEKVFWNVADAIANSFLLRQELKVGLGLITVSDMPENLIRVFNRVTKAQPNCLIDRPFITEGIWRP
ncbi:MAG: crossover junction endodeoxyribonuclease RuvC [Candidatus Peribacteraceae bacterium]|nr:crossover junction endodeoxyribonuclease RuvC [Candidatus Peribacteraceae bacterium]